MYLAFIGLYLSSVAGLVSYFPDRYVNALVIGSVSEFNCDLLLIIIE